MSQVENQSQPLTAAKMTAMMSQVRAAGSARVRLRRSRIAAAARNTAAKAVRMYLVAKKYQLICASRRCWRQAGAVVLKSTVPGFSRHR